MNDREVLGYAIGSGLVLILFWDINASYLQYPLPSWLFWFGALPLALVFYGVTAFMLLSGRWRIEEE